MAFSVLANNIYSEIQYTLLEAVDGGVAYGSSLYTASDITDHLNHRLREFYKRTQIVTTRDTMIRTTPNERDHSVPECLIDIIRLGIEVDCSVIGTSVAPAYSSLPEAEGGASATDTSLSLYPDFGGDTPVDMSVDEADGGTP